LTQSYGCIIARSPVVASDGDLECGDSVFEKV